MINGYMLNYFLPGVRTSWTVAGFHTAVSTQLFLHLSFCKNQTNRT